MVIQLSLSLVKRISPFIFQSISIKNPPINFERYGPYRGAVQPQGGMWLYGEQK